MADCLFCKIIAGVIPSHKIYEDDAVVAFLDIHPVSTGHTLVVPKAHSTSLLDISSDDASGDDRDQKSARVAGRSRRGRTQCRIKLRGVGWSRCLPHSHPPHASSNRYAANVCANDGQPRRPRRHGGKNSSTPCMNQWKN